MCKKAVAFLRGMEINWIALHDVLLFTSRGGGEAELIFRNTDLFLNIIVRGMFIIDHRLHSCKEKVLNRQISSNRLLQNNEKNLKLLQEKVTHSLYQSDQFRAKLYSKIARFFQNFLKFESILV